MARRKRSTESSTFETGTRIRRRRRKRSRSKWKRRERSSEPPSLQNLQLPRKHQLLQRLFLFARRPPRPTSQNNHSRSFNPSPKSQASSSRISDVVVFWK